MPFEVLLPQWGMGMNDGLLIKWLKAEGDAVAKGDGLVEIESSKVNGEVEAPGDGILARIVVPEGMTVDTGTLLAVILAEGETADLPDPISKAPPASAPAAPAASAPASSAPAAATPTGGRQQVTPIARRLAKELNIDLASVAGSGPRGRITEDDVRAAASGATPAAGSGTAAATGPPPGAPEAQEVTQLSGLRATIARRMTESSQIPTVTLTTEVDVTDAQGLMEQLVRDWRKARIRPQFQDIILRAVARALSEHPRANAHFFNDEVHQYGDVNLGFAMAVTDGLVVPVIHNADSKPLLELAQHVRDAAKRVRAGEQTVEDFTGGTFSVTSLSHYGIDAFDPLLNPPEVGILGVGRIVEKPAVVDGAIVARSMMWLGLTFDHRAWDGAPAGDFLQSISKYLSNPGWMLD